MTTSTAVADRALRYALPLLALPVLALAAVGLLHGALGTPATQVMQTFGISYDLAARIVTLVLQGLGFLVGWIFPPAAPYVNLILDLARVHGFEYAVQW